MRVDFLPTPVFEYIQRVCSSFADSLLKHYLNLNYYCFRGEYLPGFGPVFLDLNTDFPAMGFLHDLCELIVI